MAASFDFLNRGLSAILFLITVFACIGTAAGFMGRYWWVFELASHFRVQYFYLLMLCGLIFLAGGRFQGAIVAGVFALANLYLVASPLEGMTAKASVAPGQSKVFRALLANVSYDNKAYQKLYQLVDTVVPDFVVLIEVNNRWLRALEPLQHGYPYKQVKIGDRAGIALLSRIPFENVSIKDIGPSERRSVIAGFDVEGRQFILIGAHPRSPTSGTDAKSRNNQLTGLARIVSEQEDPIIMLGDLNISPWSPIFTDLLRSSGLRDSRTGFGLQPTWPVRYFPFRIPIDHVLVSSKVTVHDRKIEHNIGSDHYPVVVDFSVTNSH